MTYQGIQDNKDKDLGQDEAFKPIQHTDDSFQVCGCTDTAADRIGFAIREARRYEDGGMWNGMVCVSARPGRDWALQWYQ